jgi:hypothetical protein
MAVQEGSANNCRICIRGEPDDLGESVPRGWLTVLSSTKEGRRLLSDPSKSGRLELAGWIASPDNPLTARVIVNRVWRHLFGRGIVPTVDNFGASGERPSHPELLDHLAQRFVQEGWSLKRLIRAITLTRTYQMSCDFDEANYQIDPDNVLLWRVSPRRLDAEAQRDAMLAVSGQLGLSPPAGSPIAKVGDGQVGRGLNLADIDAKSRHRSVYLPILRNAVPESLQLFDFAEPSLVIGQRDVTTVPSQALYLLNSDFVQEQARAIGERLLALSGDDAHRVDYLYQAALTRSPTDDERRRALDFIAFATERLGSAQSAWSALSQAVLASAEFRYLN